MSKAKLPEFEPPESFGRDWGYCRTIDVLRCKQLPAAAMVKVKGTAEPVQAEEGDYVLLSQDGTMQVLPEADFNAEYTIVSPAKLDTHFRQTPG